MKILKMKFYIICLLFAFGCSTSQQLIVPKKEEQKKASLKAREYFLKGIFLQAEERFSDALVQFHKAQIFDTSSATIHNSLAENYIKLDEIDPAFYHLAKAKSLNADNIDSHRLLGEIYIKTRNDDNAIQAYENVLKLDPYDDNARSFLFFLYEIGRAHV